MMQCFVGFLRLNLRWDFLEMILALLQHIVQVNYHISKIKRNYFLLLFRSGLTKKLVCLLLYFFCCFQLGFYSDTLAYEKSLYRQDEFRSCHFLRKFFGSNTQFEDCLVNKFPRFIRLVLALAGLILIYLARMPHMNVRLHISRYKSL